MAAGHVLLSSLMYVLLVGSSTLAIEPHQFPEDSDFQLQPYPFPFVSGKNPFQLVPAEHAEPEIEVAGKGYKEGQAPAPLHYFREPKRPPFMPHYDHPLHYQAKQKVTSGEEGRGSPGMVYYHKFSHPKHHGYKPAVQEELPSFPLHNEYQQGGGYYHARPQSQPHFYAQEEDELPKRHFAGPMMSHSHYEPSPEYGHPHGHGHGHGHAPMSGPYGHGYGHGPMQSYKHGYGPVQGHHGHKKIQPTIHREHIHIHNIYKHNRHHHNVLREHVHVPVYHKDEKHVHTITESHKDKHHVKEYKKYHPAKVQEVHKWAKPIYAGEGWSQPSKSKGYSTTV